MPISNRSAHVFCGVGLCLGIGPPFCWRWFNWPILRYDGAAPRSRSVQTTKGTDVYQALHMMSKHTFNYILRAAHSTAFMVVRATLHGRAQVVNKLRNRYGSAHSGGISQITEENFDVGIVHELRRRLPSNEDAN